MTRVKHRRRYRFFLTFSGYCITLFCIQTSRHGTFLSQSRGSSSWFTKFKIPEFSVKTKEALTSNKISKGVRSEIVSCLGFEMWRHTKYPTGDEYNAVCSMLVNEYPALKDTIGNGYVSAILN